MINILILDYFNFLYARFYDLDEELIITNLSHLAHFALAHNIKIHIVFDGTHWNYIQIKNKYVSLFFSHTGSTADQLMIKKYCHLQGQYNYLVTKDRKLIQILQKTSTLLTMHPETLWKKLDIHIKGYDKIYKKSHSGLKKITELQDDELDNLYINNL